MSAKVGQIYKVICNTSDPFFESYYMVVAEIKTDVKGVRWLKTYFLHPDETGKFQKGVLDSTEEEEKFLKRFSLYSESDVVEPKAQAVTNAINQLEVAE